MKIFSGLAVISASLVATFAVAQAEGQEPAIRAALERHIVAFNNRDLPALGADYADDAVMVLADQVFQGKAATMKFFEIFFTAPKNILNTDAAEFELRINTVQGDVGTMVWVANRGKPNAMTAEDVFVFRNGKIVFQTAMKVGPFEDK